MFCGDLPASSPPKTQDLASLGRVLSGVAIGVSLAFPLGALFGLTQWGRVLLTPFVSPLRYVPIPALLPLSLLFFGVGEKQKIFIVAWAAFFVMFRATISAAENVRRESIDLGRTNGFKGWQLFLKIVFPAMKPILYSGLQESLAYGWSCIILAEMLGGNSGLGYRAFHAMRYLRADTVFVYLAVIFTVGGCVDLLFSKSRRWALPWASVPELSDPGRFATRSETLRSSSPEPTTDVPAIVARRISKEFSASRRRRCVISELDVTVRQGEIVVIVGRSGCGKTTLLRMIAGLLSPDSGEIRIHGRPVEEPYGLGMVFQNANCLPWLSVEGNVTFGAKERTLDLQRNSERFLSDSAIDQGDER